MGAEMGQSRPNLRFDAMRLCLASKSLTSLWEPHRKTVLSKIDVVLLAALGFTGPNPLPVYDEPMRKQPSTVRRSPCSEQPNKTAAR